jgi:hypothetical protein
MQDHLFISYAGEDWCFVEWLALRLAAEGYKVWCDRIKLLGGESYPRDIDAAIKNRTFRFLAILSRNSIQKANPVKERTLALNLARERQENFVIPINLDGLSASELDWMVSDLTYIPFNLSWAQGLAQLLKQLVKSNTPMSFPNGRSAAANWFNSNNLLVRRKERLWSNVAEIVEYPRDFYRFEIDPRTSAEQRLELLKEWPYFAESDVLWSFESPTQRMMTKYCFEREGKINDWRSRSADERHIR